jgi:hypothetical protein
MQTERSSHQLDSVLGELAAIRETIRTAHADINDGRLADLSGMDERISQLCSQALALPAHEARATLPGLLAVRDTVDSLIADLASRAARRHPAAYRTVP